MIEDYYPPPADLFDLELETLGFIGNQHALAGTRLERIWLRAQEEARKVTRSGSGRINFHADFPVYEPKHIRRIDVGFKLELNETGGSYSEVSYFYCVGEQLECPSRILKKCHFDFEPLTNRNRDEPKPSLHFQMPGTLSPGLVGAGYSDEHINHLAPWSEKPRFPCLPGSFALLLNVLFHEFGDGENPDLLKLVYHDWWRGLVDRAEQLIYRRYFEACCSHWKNGPAKGTFLRHRLYGLED